MRIASIHIRSFKGLEDVHLDGFGDINAFIGKNNSGKSTILHALDMAGMALSTGNWNAFQPMLEIKDMLASVGDFEMDLTFRDGSHRRVTSDPGYGPRFDSAPDEAQKYASVLILPDPGIGMMRRQNRTPSHIMSLFNSRNFAELNALDILYALKYYATHSQRGFAPDDYESILCEIREYFPDLEQVESDRTEMDVATLTYTEYGRKLDILYSGTGLKHFIDVLVKTTLSKASVVLLDEPEMGLHADLQRRFMDYLRRLSIEKGTQFFLATQSQVILNYADDVTFFRVTNQRGKRDVTPVPSEAVHTIMGDLGIRPSDVFNQDLCLLVEGATEVIFFEHVIRVLYKAEFDKVAVGIQQYGGGAAEGIIDGTIDISNITPAQRYTLWTHDRDAAESSAPSTIATKFKNRLEKDGLTCHIWQRREIEYYYPESVHVAAQQGDVSKERATKAILNSDQLDKYRMAAKPYAVCVPNGKYLRKLLREKMISRADLPQEIRDLVEGKLIPWGREVLGVDGKES